MCDHCMKHGSGGKWYLNAAGYSEEVARTHNLRALLLEQYRNFEQISVRKVAGITAQSVPSRGTHRAGRAPVGRRCNSGELSSRTDHRQAAAVHPGKRQVPPHPDRSRAAVHRAQPEGIHRHDLVRPLSLHQQPLLLRVPRVRRHPPPRGLRDRVDPQGGIPGAPARRSLPRDDYSRTKIAAPFSNFNRFAVIQTCVDHTFVHRKAERDLGYHPIVSREEAFKRSLAWLRDFWPA